MLALRIHINELQEGCILAEDVFSKTNRPIISKQTVLTVQLIDVLKAFLIKDVEVEKTLISGTPFIPSEAVSGNEAPVQNMGDLTFLDLFLKGKQDHKKEFVSWQSGIPVDIAAIRSLLMPLIDKIEGNTAYLFRLHKYHNQEDYLYHHSLAVGILSAYIAKRLNYSKGDIAQIALAGCLADCGMAKISNSILMKKTTLTLGEYEEVKSHPINSYQMVKENRLLKQEAKVAILQHHERLDGSGYPFGDKGVKIHPFANIIAVADTYQAMTSERLYKPSMSPFKALEIINEDHFGKFDVAPLKVIKSGIMNFSTGSKVRLSDGEEAEILFISDKDPTRPIVKLSNSDKILPLEEYRQLYIEEVL
ncbi:HD-GYP domain-containing protein [Mesobacillus foraminis]|uniref:HD-GYP domain-containing protein n=1 Tax=Mesobacillus foraminis TaxID=279826 RepID=UPI002810E27C|nr:HD-GYP domain-containing protein [Mesobacillus foraminis]